MKLSIDKIKLDSKLERLFPKMPKEEFEALKRDIKVNGLIKPLVLAQDYTLVDGYHRLKACKSLKMKEVEVDIKDNIKTFGDKLRFCFASNSVRRHLTGFQKVYCYLKYRKTIMKKDGNVPIPLIRDWLRY